ncbi:MAG: 3-phosphoglycerate dehydrogenase family protein [Nannocystaceae bacterium]|nr:hydroxyacid dehydrogenase [Myxococcales bacterium]
MSEMVILIADAFSSRGVESLEGIARAVHYRPELDAKQLAGAVVETGAHIVVVRSTKVTADALNASDRLSLVIRAGAGVDTIDLAAASRRGIFVANCPGKNAIAVAELTMGLILALDRRIVDATVELRAGTWNKGKYGKGRGLLGQRLGLVGFGTIAREVALRARAFGLDVSAYKPSGVSHELAEQHHISVAPDLDTLLRTSDIVSVHVPLSDATRHLIGRDQLALMKPAALLINTARDGVVDDAALAEAVREGRVRAGLDVFEGEPVAKQAEFASPLLRHDGVYATPHIGASTAQAERAIGDEVVRIIRAYITEGVVHNTVNIVTDREVRYTLVVRHLDRVGVLASILLALRERKLNVLDMRNIVFARGEAACATINLQAAPEPALLESLRAHEAILAVELRG